MGLGPGGSPGGYAEYVALDEWRPLAIPETVSDELAVLEDWRISLDLMAQGKVRADSIVTEESFLPLERIQEAFVGLMRPSHQVQLVVAP